MASQCQGTSESVEAQKIPAVHLCGHVMVAMVVAAAVVAEEVAVMMRRTGMETETVVIPVP